MGIFSKIKKALKGIVRGVKKVFKAIGKAVGKLMKSKLGKFLLIAAAVVTGGAALAAGWGAATATTGGFVAKFMAGGKAFLTALAHPIKAVKGFASGGATGAAEAVGAIPGAGGAAAHQAAQAAQTATSVTPSNLLAPGGIGPPAPAGSTVSGAVTTVPAGASQAAANAANAAATQAPQGFLSKAAGSTGSFLKSTGGGTLVGNVLSGVAQGKAQEELWKREDAKDRENEAAWADPNRVGAIQSTIRDVQVPGGYLERARRVDEFLNNRTYRYPTSVGDPYQVAQYAQGDM